ncbi:3-hydroxyacyl-ACP dehydratase FabZ family protein [Amycolatopsis sp. cmx-11-51]|uniref:3-hydroxyacyl-ACP dehydratase FabZ family protein n=1 Tax=Amycolatopsis sp. cmx-11-51 TaxID=2785797 RepID=UPI0039E62C3B
MARPVVLRDPVVVEGEWQAATTMLIGAEEPVFAGHFPGFPILPGVCVLECVHHSLRTVAPELLADARMDGIESARFTGTVVPGDELIIDLRWNTEADRVRCSAKAHSGQSAIATIRLTYRRGGAG